MVEEQSVAASDQPPVEPEKLYRIVPFQMNRDDGTGSFRAGEIHPASEFTAELDRLLEIGALVPAE